MSADESVDVAAFDEPFLEDLVEACTKKRLFQVKKERLSHFNRIRFLLLVMSFAIIIAAYYYKVQPIIAVPLVVLQALISTSLFGLIAHEHTHRDFPENKFLRQLLILVWPILWPFISRKALIYEHNSHHVKIGDPDHDYEVIAFSHFIRYSGMVEHRRIHKIQHRVSILWYMFYANIITTIGGIFTSFWDQRNKEVALRHSLSVVITMLIYIVLPYIVHGSLWYFLVLYLTFQCVLFTFVYLGAAINHFTPMATNEPIPEEMRNKYAYYVCHNTTNFAPKSKFWFYFTGGFNIQIEHHLNAFVPVENLKYLQVEVKALCEKFNYPYIEYASLSQLYKAHYDYLYSLSKADISSKIEQEVINKKSYQARSFRARYMTVR